jgi:hypothetical protein
MPKQSGIYRQGVCPEGWHIPTKAEWDALFTYVGGPTVAAKHLKAMEGWDSCGPTIAGNENNLYSCEDTHGFAALPGGIAVNGLNNYWLSTSASFSMFYNQDNINWGSGAAGGSHVRCIRGGEKCGTEGLMYNPSNANLRCRANLVQAKCGTEWYNTADTTKRCQSYYVTNSHVEAQCGNYLYHSDNPSFRCENGVLEVLCETGWLSHAENYMEEQCYVSEMSDREYVVETLCGHEWYNAADPDLRCQNSEIETKCGNRWYHAFNPNVRCENEAMEIQCIDGWHNYDDYYMKDACFGSMEDADGTKYKTVKIGRQTWMAENLNIAPKSGGSQCIADAIGPNHFCLAKAGRLYDWGAAMVVCPEGWRLPV